MMSGPTVLNWLLENDETGSDHWAEYVFFGVSETGDRETEDWNLPRYRDFMAEQPAYKWLLAKFACGQLLSSAEPNYMQAISDAIIEDVSHLTFQIFSRHRNPHLYDMTFSVD